MRDLKSQVGLWESKEVQGSSRESEGVKGKRVKKDLGHTGVSKGFLMSLGRSLGSLPKLQEGFEKPGESLGVQGSSKGSMGVQGSPGASRGVQSIPMESWGLLMVIF